MFADFALTKMRRNASNDHEDEFISPPKKLKFGVDTILGNVNIHSDDELRHKGNIIESPISTNSSEHSLIPPFHYHQQVNFHHHMTAANYPSHPFWRPTLRPFTGENYLENNVTIPDNGFYIPSPMSSLFWSLDHRNNTRPRMLRRAVFSDQQRKGLEVAFLKQKYISKPDRKKLAQRLDLKDSQVKIWFQNRRMKWRNTKERELFSSNHKKNDCSDYQHNEEMLPSSPSARNDNHNQSNPDENIHSRKE